MTSAFPPPHSRPTSDLDSSDESSSPAVDSFEMVTAKSGESTLDEEEIALVSIVLDDPVDSFLTHQGASIDRSRSTTRIVTVQTKPSSKTTQIQVGVRTSPSVSAHASETDSELNHHSHASASFLLTTDVAQEPSTASLNCVASELGLGQTHLPRSSATDSVSSSPSLTRRPRIPRIPGYDFLRLLGRGGMGEVYVAQQLTLYRLVAVKIVLIHDSQTSAEEKTRFVREAEMVARIRHPNIVQVIDSGEHDGLPYYVMEYVRGGSLADRLMPPGTLQPIRETVRLIRTLAIAVEAMHRRGVIHLDLKPANILMEGDPNAPFWSCDPKVGDFGLARRFDLRCPPEERPGTVRGSPDYIAPELATGQLDQVGPATDVYSLGVILYEMLMGQTPFHGATPSETIHRVVYDRVVPPRERRPELPRDLETIILKCLERSPANRYPYAQALADDLERVLDRRPIAARQISWMERICRCLLTRPTLTTVSLLALLGWMLAIWLAILYWFDL